MRMIVRLFFIFRDFSKQMTKKNISSFAASAAFFLFLSVIPLLMALCAVLPFTPLTEENLVMAIERVTPDVMNVFVEQTVADVYARSAGTITVYALVTLWSAAKAMLALIQGLNEVNDIVEKRNYIILRTVASFYTIILLAATILSMLVMVFGNVIVGIALRDVPQLDIVAALLIHFRFLLSWFLLTIIFAMIYTFIPGIKQRFKRQLPGAAFAAVVWSAASYVFSVYVDNLNGFGTYGSLTMVVILMFWFYMMMYILLVGAHINKYFGPVYKFLFGWLDKSAKTH